MLSPLEAYYADLPEHFRDLMLAARDLVLAHPAGWTPHYKWRCPTFAYRGKHVGHLYHNKAERRCYLGFAYGSFFTHPLLRDEGRKRVRMLLLDPDADLPAAAIDACIAQTSALVDAKFGAVKK